MANDLYPLEFDSDVGKVRVLIADTHQFDYDQDNKPRYRLSDDEIKAFLEIADKKVYSAASAALWSIAANEALINKVIKTEDLQTDGAKLATELRLLARDMLNRQKELDEKEAALGDAFVYMPMGYPYTNPDW